MHVPRLVYKGIAARDSAYRRMRRTGKTLSGRDIWTDEEIKLLREHYPNYELLQQLLIRRERQAIKFACSKRGISAPRPRWSEQRKLDFRKMFEDGSPVSEISERFSMSPSYVSARASTMKLGRPPKPLRIIGIPIVDAIRARAIETGNFIGDLDFWAKAGGYFYSAKSVRWSAIRRGLKALGGVLISMGPKPKIRWESFDD